jgi:hypothetical protein
MQGLQSLVDSRCLLYTLRLDSAWLHAGGGWYTHYLFVSSLILLTVLSQAYLEFIYDRLKDKNPDGSLQIMYTIHGMLVSSPIKA